MRETVKFEGPYSLIDPNRVEGQRWLRYKKRGGVYLWTIKTDKGYRPIYVGISETDMAFRTWGHLRAYLCGDYSILNPDTAADASKKLDDDVIRRANDYSWEDRARDISEGRMVKIQDGLPEFLKLVEIFFYPAQGEDMKELMKLESGIINYFGKEHLENSRRSTAEEFSEGVEIAFADISLKPFHVGTGYRVEKGSIPMLFKQ